MQPSDSLSMASQPSLLSSTQSEDDQRYAPDHIVSAGHGVKEWLTNQINLANLTVKQLGSTVCMASQPIAASTHPKDDQRCAMDHIVLTSHEAKEWLARSIVWFKAHNNDNPSHPHQCLTRALDVHEASKAVKTFEPCKYTINMMAHPEFQKAIQVVDQNADHALLGQLRKRVVFEAKFHVSADRLKRRNYLDFFA